MFFICALEDCSDINEFSVKDVAQALMNYAPYEHGFFWWGGYGVSTEHTAYLNLMNGIPAPQSGSIEQNGATVAEQIGGQIFIPADCEYARVVKDVIGFYDKHPDNWIDCYRFIFENYGYDKYPGNCHIIPNTAVMILSLLYGREDFADTINTYNMSGWDTDCNVGNVGCIIGVFCGLNIMDVPYCASYFAKMSYLLSGETLPEPWQDILENRIESCHFEYPGSTHAIHLPGVVRKLASSFSVALNQAPHLTWLCTWMIFCLAGIRITK